MADESLGDLAASTGGDPDDVLDAFLDWTERRGIELYDAQSEAVFELLAGAHVIVNTPTGSGKSLIAAAAHFDALCRGARSFYTRAHQGPGVGEVLRALRELRRGSGRHAHR